MSGALPRLEGEGLSGEKIRVLVVDDTAFMRKAVEGILSEDSELEVIATAENGREALDKIRRLHPDVITLDIDMPVMDGLTTIRHIMIESPLPIVVLSSLITDGRVTFEALRLGVMDFVPKPSGAVSVDIGKSRRHLIDRIKVAHSMRLKNVRRVRLPRLWDLKLRLENLYRFYPLDYIVAVGTTLCGPNTVIRLLAHLSPTLPAAVVVSQEISPRIIDAFVRQFNENVPWKVETAADGKEVEQGACYICSNEFSVTVVRDDKGVIRLRVAPGEENPLNRLYTTAAQVFRSNTIGVLLSGLGSDGAQGFSAIRRVSGVTLAKDTSFCVFPNLTENAIQQGVVDVTIDEWGLAPAIESYMR